MSLWNYYLNNDKRIIDKWTHYFPIYERFLAPWVNKTVNFLEIGVSEGGSLQMWKSYLGPLSTIVGVDIDPSCKQIEENGIKIRIGDQSSESFLTSLVDEFGTFDVVIDDGSHQMAHVNASFQFLYPKISKNGVYLVEDLHCAYDRSYGGGLGETASFIEKSKHFIDLMHSEFAELPHPNMFSALTRSIQFYPGVVVFERGSLSFRHIGRTGRVLRQP